MQLTIQTFLIVCPFLFLAGLIDAIGGGGGLISLPAYMIAGLPPHTAIATNKFSSSFGTALATYRFIKNKLVNMKLAIPSIFAAILGSSIGASISVLINEQIMKYLLLVVLPITAYIVLHKNLFHDNVENEILLNRHTYLTVTASAFIIGIYDGFYGPGTGTFLIIAFTLIAGMNIQKANAQAKVINLTTNLTSLTVFLLHGQVLIPLGAAAALCNMAGGYLGAGLAMKDGSRFVKPSILLVLILLLLKVLGIFG